MILFVIFSISKTQIRDNGVEKTSPNQHKCPESTNKYEETTCARILLLLPHIFSQNGHGSQMNNYLMGIAMATYTNRSMLLLEIPLQWGYQDGSQFGCPIDSFEGEVTASNFSSAKMREDFPMGFSRLIFHPQWLSRGCKIPCADQYNYMDWQRIARSPENRIICTDPDDGSTTDVVVYEGYRLRKEMGSQSTVRQMMYTRDDPVESIGFQTAYDWARVLGAKPNEASYFASTINGKRQIDDYVLGLINRSGFLKLQPWIERDVHKYLESSFDLPLKDVEYSAIHVRRGDKLIWESHNAVVEYWKQQGYDENNLPHNYIPFIKYLEAWD